MKKKHILLIILGLFFTLSCEKYLEMDPHQELTYDAAFATIEDFEYAMRGVYYSMHEDEGYFDGLFLIMPDVLSDNLIMCSEGRLTFSEIKEWNYTSANYYVYVFWRQVYRVIHRCNQIITRLDGGYFEDDTTLTAQKNDLLGEALAVRSMCYFDLVRFYGKHYTDASSTDFGVPFVTGIEPTEPERNTVEECYTSIVADLERAKTLMTNGPGTNTRFTPEAISAMLARVYLYMEDWQNAIDNATEVLGSMSLSVASITDFPGVWKDENDEGVIFKVRITTQDATETTSGSKIGTYYSQTGPSGTKSEHVCSYELYQLYQDNDIRKSSYISTSEYNGKDFNHIWKYKQRTGENTPDLVDAKVLRVAEQLLIRAEAYVNLAAPNEAAALADLNTLRAARYSNFSPLSEMGQQLIDAIDKERRLELAFEGHRWFDLKRKGMAVERDDDGDQADGSGLHWTDLTLPAGDTKRELPIPHLEIEANPNISQNPGY